MVVNESNKDEGKTIKIPEKTFEFLAYLARQDVTLPAVLVDHLEWNRYTKEEVKTHLDNLNRACTEARR